MEDNTKQKEVEYDIIADEYKKATQRDLRKFTLESTLIKYFGNLKDKEVLDLACGEGDSSRLLKRLGAKRVLGIDLSSKEIQLAQEQEGKEELGVDYKVGDATSELGDIGKFDVITAVMLMHYCPDLKTLEKAVSNIKKHLKSGGVFVTSTANPEVAPHYNNYGVKMESSNPEEGAPYQVTLSDFQGNEFCTFTSYYWKEETYRKLFEEEGFIVEWFNSFVSEKGIEKYGKEFWKEFEEKPIYSILRATLV